MISCTEFIWAYNELFKYIEHSHDRAEVDRLWEGISDDFLNNLRELVREKGTRGMQEYWTHTLTEEGALHTMTCTDDDFAIHMHECPSVALLHNGPAERYRDYCKHCDTLYRRVIEPFGYEYHVEYIDEQRGECRLEIKRRQGEDG